MTGRRWAYACALLGAVASIAANVAHSFVPPTGAAPAWSPPVGAVIASVFWPAALVFAIEAFARVAWPVGWRHVLLRFGGLLPVALVAAVVSYMHLSGLLASYAAGWFEVHVGPLAVDGLMVIGTAALIVTSRPRQMPPEQPERTADEHPAEQSDERSSEMPPSAVKLAKLRLRAPAVTQQDAAKRAGLSLSTVRRHWALTTPAVNGHGPHLEVPR